jgi:hypothetical protein
MIILVVLPGQSDPIDSVSLEPLFDKVQKDSSQELPFWANSFALLDQGSWIERKLILGVFEAAEVLPVEYVSEIR